jgi:hypothetical protein
MKYDMDLFDVDFHALAALPVEEVRELLFVPPKSEDARAGGSAGVFEREGMSELQQQRADERAKREGGSR